MSEYDTEYDDDDETSGDKNQGSGNSEEESQETVNTESTENTKTTNKLIHQDINTNDQDTDNDLNSSFVVQPQSFQCLDNIYITSNSKKDPYFQNLFNRKYPPIYSEGSLDNPMSKPDVNDQLMKKMKLDIKADNPKDYYHGIFGTQRQKLGSEYKTKFVMLFADTKYNYINQNKMIFHIIDCDKTTEWFSTHSPNPAITLYFPYHLLTLNHIALRTHMNHNFGEFFPQKFKIYGIDDDKNVICIGNYDTNKLTDYEVKMTFPLQSTQPLRAIHIVNEGKFGLSYLDLFGMGTFNESKILFSENFLLSPSTYENVQLTPLIYDNQPSHKALKKKILSKFRKDEELYNSSSFDDLRTGPLRYVEALDLFDHSILKKLKYYYSNRKKEEESTEQYHLFSYTQLKFRLTGIKIKSPPKDENPPFGFNVYGHLNDPNSTIDEWRHIFSSKNELIIPNEEYVYPIDNPNEFTSFLITSYGNEFDIGNVLFYGSAILFKTEKKIPENFQVLFKEPPVGIFTDTSQPGIFETMQNYYGSMINGFASVLVNRNDKQLEWFGVEDFKLTKIYKPYICIHFRQHQIKITSIKICASNNCFKHFIIATSEKIIYEDDHLFKPNEEYIVSIKDCGYTTCLIIHSFDLPYTIKKLEIFGYVKKGKEYNLKPVFPIEIIKTINRNRKNASDPKEMFQKEFMSAVIPNPDIEFSGLKSAKQDIVSIGSQLYRNFVSFYNYGENGVSILTKNPDNYWVSTTNGDENSFTLLFNHHSVRLTNIFIHTPNPCFDKYMLHNFYIYGYNSHVKRFDCILCHESDKPLESMSSYNFSIKQENQQFFYRLFTLISYSGRFAISYIKLFGDVIKEDDNPPNKIAQKNNYSITYNAMPYIEAFTSKNKEKGLFQKAVDIFGPTLKNFVKVRHYPGDDVKYYDIWGIRNENYVSANIDDLITISFYFINHEVYINGYDIKPFYSKGVDYWCIIGCTDADDRGVILDHQYDKKLNNSNSYYYFEIDEYNQRAFKIIRFVGLNGLFGFSSLDFYGKAVPSPRNVLSQEDLDKKYFLPKKVKKMYVGV